LRLIIAKEINLRTAIIVFPGSNCDRDAAEAIETISGHKPRMVWHRDAELPEVDLVILPGGFAFGDYLRPGAMAARSSIMKDVQKHAKSGRFVVGICNGFQVLTEVGLLPGVLMRNAGLNFVCKPVSLLVERDDTAFSNCYDSQTKISVPIAHHDGNYFAADDELAKLEDQGQVVFRYTENPNGSIHDIAGICNAQSNVFGMMPHPERAIGNTGNGSDGTAFFKSLMNAVA